MNFESRNNETPHPESQDVLTALLDGQLTAEQAAEVRDRLEREPQLRELYAQLESQRAQLRGLPRLTASSGFASRVAAELRQRAVVAEPPRKSDEDLGPRGGWRSVYLLAGALAAVLLLGVFLWPRSMADNNSAVVAQTDAQVRRRELEARKQERDSALNAAEPTPAAVQRAPAGNRPEARGGAAADGSLENNVAGLAGGGAAGNQPGAAPAANAGQAAPPTGELLAAADAPGAVAGVPQPLGDSMSTARKAQDPAAKSASGALSASGEAAGKVVAEAAPRPAAGLDEGAASAAPGTEMPGGRFGDRPAVAGGALASENSLEVWMVDAAEAAKPAGKETAGMGARSVRPVEVYLAEVVQPELPGWMEELRTDAVVTQLDSAESIELVKQLQAKQKLPMDQAHGDFPEVLARQLNSALQSAPAAAEPAKPSESASAILDDRPGQVVESGAGDKSAAEAASGMNIAYIELEGPAEIEAVINRSIARQAGSGIFASGGGGGRTGEAGAGEPGRQSKRDQRSGLESNLNLLRSQVGNQLPAGEKQQSEGLPPLPQASQSGQRGNALAGQGGEQRWLQSGRATRQIIIIVRPQ